MIREESVLENKIYDIRIIKRKSDEVPVWMHAF